MKRYKYILLEQRKLEWKGWYNPSSNYFRQFNTNGLHSEIAEQDLHMNEAQAIQHGYYRIFCGHELDVDSYTLPDAREFKSLQYVIEQNSYKKFEGTRWNVATVKGFWFFPKLSFLFADSIKDGKHKVL